MRSFVITAAVPSVKLEAARQGTLSFTVSNALGRPVRGRVALAGEGGTRREWLTLIGEAEYDFSSEETRQFSVKLALPPTAPPGQYPLHINVVNVANPDEEYTTGPTVWFEAPAATLPAQRKFPWWIPAAAGVLVAVLVVALLVSHRASGGGGPGQVVAAASQPRVDFNGTNSFIDLRNPRSLDLTGPITLEAWIRAASTNGLRDIVAHGYAPAPQGEVVLRINSGVYQVGSWNGADHLAGFPMPPDDVGAWVHLAGVHDGTSWILYRNGEQVASTADAVGAVPVAERWAIGARGGGSERFFDGEIRDVRIWSVARSAADIRANMSRLLSGKEPGLVGFWPINDSEGDAVRELSPNQNDGSIHNGVWVTPTAPRARRASPTR